MNINDETGLTGGAYQRNIIEGRLYRPKPGFREPEAFLT